MKKIYYCLVEASKAQAQWELNIARVIFSSKKRLFILFLLTLPAILFSIAVAADALPDIIGGKEAYGPAFYSNKVFIVSIVVGLCAGLITGCIGAGGGFIIAPALMTIGVKGILAVGTDLFHIFAKAIMGTAVHKKLGNVNVSLAIAFLVGSILGATGGGFLNRMLYDINPVLSDAFISLVYTVLLGFLGIYALVDFLKLRKAPVESVGAHPGESPKGALAASGKVGLPERLQASKIPPLIRFDEDLVPGGKTIPAVYVAIAGVVVGLAAAIMGVGGGFLTFPIFIYVLGVSSFTTVGTDILQIIFTAGYASITQYAIYGFVFYTLAMGMLLGSLIGIQIGALTTKVVKGVYIRGFYAVSILAGFINRGFAMPSKLTSLKIISIPKSTLAVIDVIGTWVFFIVIGLFAIWVVGKFLGNIGALHEEVA